MITKIHQSNNLAGTLRYVYQEHKGAEVIDATCVRDDLKGAQAEIARAMEQKPGIKAPVFHAILSVPSGDVLTNEQWRDIASEYTKRMGFEYAPYVAIRHQDTEHHHIHIVASRVDITGQLVSDSNNYFRSQQIARDLEIKHDLTRVPSSWEVPERAPTQHEYHGLERTGQESTRDRMREAIGAALERHDDAPGFAAELARQDIKLVPKITQDERIVGVYFEHQDTRIPGSKVSRDYSWPKLSERLGYEPERDYAKLTKAPEHDAQAPKEREPTREEPSKEATRAREIIRHRPAKDTRASQRQAPERRAAPQPPRRPIRTLERPSAPAPRHEPTRVPPARTPETPPTPENRSQEATKTSEPSHPEQWTLEDAQEHMRKALESANYKQGWKEWAQSMRAQGVEPIPKGTQADPTKVRGMYLEANGHTVPGSRIDRSCSLKGLEGRLGAYEAARDAQAFRTVEVPGRGREPMPEAPSRSTPEPHVPTSTTPTPSSGNLRPLVERLRKAGIQLEVEPKHFAGQWRGAYQDSQGGTWGVISKGNTAAFVRLEAGERVIEVERGERGQLEPRQVLPSHDSLELKTSIEWRNDGERKALLKVEPEPIRPEPKHARNQLQGPERGPALGPSSEKEPEPTAKRSQEPEGPAQRDGLDMTAEQWVQMQRESGKRAYVLEVGEMVRGKLQSERLELRDGPYHVVHSAGGSSVLIKTRDELEAMRRDDTTPKISVRVRRDESLAIKDLSRDRGWER